jgi:hypothetical protein
MSDQQEHDQQLSFASAVIADARTQNFTQATREMFLNSKELKRISEQWCNGMPEIHQGRVFEILEVMKFNREAAINRSSLRAVTTESEGKPTDLVDIKIQKEIGKRIAVLREFQAKSCNDAAKSLHALSDSKYGDMGRLLPKDQGAKARQLAEQRISKGTLKSNDYKQTLKNMKGELSHGKIRSGGTTYKESLNAFKNPNMTAIKLNIEALADESNKAGLEGGVINAGLSASVSGATRVYRLIKGEDQVGALIAEVTVDTAKGFAAGYVTSAMGKGVGHVAEQAGLGGIAKCNAHTAIAAGILQSGKSFIKYLNDEIDEEQMLEEVSHTVITGTSSFYYGALGQVLIPVPVVGAIIGSTVGYFVGNILYHSGLISLGDTVGVKLAKERRKRIESLCLQAIPLIQRHRGELQAVIQQSLTEQAELFESAFSSMEAAISGWNPAECIYQLERICNTFDTGLPFKTFSEFDEFMNDDSTILEL